MNTTSSVVIVGAVVAAGMWQREKTISMRFVVGMGVFTLGLAAIGEINAEFARQLGMLMVVSSLFLYGPDIAKGLGFTK